MKKIIDNGQFLGIKYFILPLVDNSSVKNLNHEDILINEMLKISRSLDSKSMILFETDYSPKNVIKFVKKFNSKFGINYDTGNSASLNYDFNDEIKYFKYIKNIHIKDRLISGPTVRLGTGNLILQTARSKNGNELEEILINRNFVKKFL